MNDEENTQDRNPKPTTDTDRPPVVGAAPATSSARLKRGAVARKLGVSVATIRRMEERGDLHPVTAANGERLHDPAEIEAVGRVGPVAITGTSPMAEAAIGVTSSACAAGEIAARIFKRLDEGEGLTAIVIAEKLDPSIVKRVEEQWRDLKSVDLSSDSVPRALAEIAEVQRLDHQELANLISAFRQLVEAFNQVHDVVYRRG